MKKISIIILIISFGFAQAQKKQFIFPAKCIGNWNELQSLEEIKINALWDLSKLASKPLPDSYVEVLVNGYVRVHRKVSEHKIEYKYYVKIEKLNGKEILIFNPYGICGIFKTLRFEVIELSEDNIKLKALN